jgi:hypothetical protein
MHARRVRERERDGVLKTNFLIFKQVYTEKHSFTHNLHSCFNSQIINSDNVQEAARETEGYFIKSGIVTVIKDALIPSGTVI